jgi:hypothetical protein
VKTIEVLVEVVGTGIDREWVRRCWCRNGSLEVTKVGDGYLVGKRFVMCCCLLVRRATGRGSFVGKDVEKLRVKMI